MIRYIKRKKIAYPYTVARQLYRFTYHRGTVRNPGKYSMHHRTLFEDMPEETRLAWIDLAHLVLMRGYHHHRDWVKPRKAQAT